MATIEAVGYLTVVITLLFLGVQLVLWAAAGYGARLAADRAAQTARVHGSTAEAGRTEAAAVLDSVAGSTLRDARASVNRTTTLVSVRITGRAHQLLPGVDPAVAVTVSMPVERPT